jgi:hypothetical protein
MQEISEKIVRALPLPATGNKVTFFTGAKLQGRECPSGFGVRTTAGGSRAYVWFHRHDGRKFLETIGGVGEISTIEAIDRCKERARAVALGYEKIGEEKRTVDLRPKRTQRLQDGGGGGGFTVADMLDLFIERYARKERGLRSADHIQNAFQRLVIPAIGRIGIYEVRRSDVPRCSIGSQISAGRLWRIASWRISVRPRDGTQREMRTLIRRSYRECALSKLTGAIAP